jgi:hypothetical protein
LSDEKILATFLHGTSYVLILSIFELGYVLGDLFSNSSGHPAAPPIHFYLNDNKFYSNGSGRQRQSEATMSKKQPL